MAKDRQFDGWFVTGVLSTGIYCRPSCPARAPLRKNVRFYDSVSDAEAAGLRPCKRCAPDQHSREERAVARAIALIKTSEGPVTLNQLGAESGYSPAHFQRLFKRSAGLTPAEYQRALRQNRADDALSKSGTVTEALYSAGFSAPSRFYDSRKERGMAAGAWRKGGAGQTLHWAVIETGVAPMLVAATDKGVCLLAFNEGEAELRARFPHADLIPAAGDFHDLFAQVVAAVECPAVGQDIPLDVRGTGFQQRVWAALRDIPPGETRSYGQLAAALGNPNASRAVGGANGANHVAVLIPCHRVIAADGSLGGYAYGTEIKAELLRREQVRGSA